MSRKKSEFVKAAGTVFELVQKLSGSIQDLGGTDDDLRKLLSDGDLRRKVAELLVTPASLQPHVVTLDLAKTLMQMIEAGAYDYVNPDINEKNFPTPKSEVEGGPYRTAPAEISLELVHFDKVMTTKGIEAELDRRGLRPATLQELLALGAKEPDLQRQFPLIALVSSWVRPDGARRVPYLDRDDGGRSLSLRWDDPGRWWYEYSRFVCARK